MNKIIFLLILLFSSHLAAVTLLGPLTPDSQPVDLVYTWVDGNDPKWRQVRNETVLKQIEPLPEGSSSQNRFRDRNELKYSLRSVQRFAPFVNHIYIVTFGQKPSWLKPHPKITIVDHEEIFPNKADLPTFNSQAIEANIHRIPNLNERFIYFNDDFLLGNDVTMGDFFDDSGKIKVLFSSFTTPKGSVLATDSGFRCAWKSTNRFLDTLYNPIKRKAIKHSPYALRKSHMQSIEKSYAPLFKKVSSHPFRNARDYVLTNGLIQYIAFHEEQATSAEIDNMTVHFGDDLVKNQKRLDKVAATSPHTYCIQDTGEATNEILDKQLEVFFETYYPDMAPWEDGESHESRKN